MPTVLFKSAAPHINKGGALKHSQRVSAFIIRGAFALLRKIYAQLKYIYFFGEQNHDFCPNINEGENKLRGSNLSAKLNFKPLS